MGEPVTIKGGFFGKEQGESYLTIAGAQPTNMSYLSWQDDEIIFRLPEFGEAGLIYVYVNGRKSNGVLFADRATLPSQVYNDQAAAVPSVISITPQSGSPGTLLSINGSGFGSSRGSGGVFFSWKAQASAAAPPEARLQEFAEVSETEFGYELWSDREIRVRVPDGAVGGNMEIRTAKGASPPVVFDLADRPGTKTFRDKRSYTINYAVDIKVNKAQAPNALYLWIPRPAVSAAQRNIELLSGNMEPYIDNYQGTNIYMLDNLAANRDVQIKLSWKIEVYSVRTDLRPQSLSLGTLSPLSEAYIKSSPQLPSDDPRITNQAAAIVGREPNPYIKARRIYEWMTGNTFSWEDQANGDIFYALTAKRIDPYLAALLYCSLLRSAGVPCQPVAGVLVNRNRQTMNHYWAEFWIDGFGWIPVDPAMGAAVQETTEHPPGAIAAFFNNYPAQENFYFGSIDSQRIAFSRGFANFISMDSYGHPVEPSRSWSLQNISEEAIGGIDSYSSRWGDITITGIYAQ